MTNSLLARSLALGVLASLLGAPSHAATASRPEKEILKDIGKDGTELNRYPIEDFLNPIYRESLAPKELPILQHRETLYKELMSSYPTTVKDYRFSETRSLAEMAYFGDASARDALTTEAALPDKSAATEGQLGLHLIDWWNAAGKADDQSKILDQVIDQSKASPSDPAIAATLKMMLDTNPADFAFAGRINDAIGKMHCPWAVQYNAMPNKIGKPLLIQGQTVTGKAFNSQKQYAGKVVLVDFWATWCPPCREEIPRVAKLYEHYHAQGFEIVGVSNDQERTALVSFLHQHTEMPWPELFVGGSEWHPITRRFGIDSIPRMYLIDRNGILRTMNGRQDMEKMIPTLLAEPTTQPAT